MLREFTLDEYRKQIDPGACAVTLSQLRYEGCECAGRKRVRLSDFELVWLSVV